MLNQIVALIVPTLLLATAVYLVRRGRKHSNIDNLREHRRKGEFIEELNSTLSQWGRFVENCEIDPLEIRDESELPLPKNEIISNSLIAIALSKDDPIYQNAVAMTLLVVAQFQPGVGKPLRNKMASAISEYAASKGDLLETYYKDELIKILGENDKNDESHSIYQLMWDRVQKDSLELLDQIETAKGKKAS